MSEVDKVIRSAEPGIALATRQRARAVERLLRGLASTDDPERRNLLLAHLEHAAHHLRGAAAMLGLEEIEALAAGLETLPGRGSLPARAELLRLAEALARVDVPASRTPPLLPADKDARVVLCVDDDDANLVLLERTLARRPHLRFVPARTGAEALALARELVPCLILVDLQLRGMSGEDVLAELRRHPATAGARVVIATADAAETQRKRLLAAGADGYMTKPLDIADVLDLLDSLRPARRVAASASGRAPARRAERASLEPTR